MDTERLLAQLLDMVGGANVVAQSALAFDALPDGWTPPLAAVAPGSIAEVVSIVRAVEEAGAALIVTGGGSKLQTGYPPRAVKPYLLLSTRRLNRVLDYQPDDMTVTCEPGVTLAQLQAHLAARSQYLPLDAAWPERATLGGMVSGAQSGFWRAAYGAPRDLVIGVRAVMTGGKEVKGGGKVVKNVAGYDVCKLFTGAWGTVGVLTELTFRVRPCPPAARLLRLDAPDIATAARAARILHHAQLAPVALLATNESQNAESSACLLALLHGADARIDWQQEEIARLAAPVGLSAPAVTQMEPLDRLRDSLARLGADTPLAGRIACLTTDVEPLLQKLQILPGLRVTADCALGLLWFALTDPDARNVEAVLKAVPADANLQWTRIDAALAPRPDISALNVWGQARETAALHRALKQSLDPRDTFAPGRFLDRL